MVFFDSQTVRVFLVVLSDTDRTEDNSDNARATAGNVWCARAVTNPPVRVRRVEPTLGPRSNHPCGTAVRARRSIWSERYSDRKLASRQKDFVRIVSIVSIAKERSPVRARLESEFLKCAVGQKEVTRVPFFCRRGWRTGVVHRVRGGCRPLSGRLGRAVRLLPGRLW